MLLSHSAAEPDELGVCFHFTLGKASGMEQPDQKPAWAQLGPLSEVAYSVQASDWSATKFRAKEKDTASLISSLFARRSDLAFISFRAPPPRGKFTPPHLRRKSGSFVATDCLGVGGQTATHVALNAGWLWSGCKPVGRIFFSLDL